MQIEPKTILCLGSKPNAIVPPAEAVYGSNSSLFRNQEKIAAIPLKVLIATSTQLGRGDETDCDYIKEKRLEILATVCDRAYVVNPKCSLDKYQALSDRAELTIWNSLQRRTLSESVSGVKEPIITRKIFQFGLRFFAAELYKLIKAFWRIHSGQNADFSPYYRVSTGMLAILLAIKENGPDAEYVVAGIGFANRFKSEAEFGDDPYVLARVTKTYDHHVEADLKVFKALVEKYRITTTDPDLAQQFDLELR